MTANQFSTLPINIDPQAMPFLTVGAWVKPTALDSNRGILGHERHDQVVLNDRPVVTRTFASLGDGLNVTTIGRDPS